MFTVKFIATSLIKVRIFYGVINAGDNFTYAHGIEETLWKLEQVFVIAQNKSGVNKLTRFQGKDRFGGANKNLKNK